MKKWHIRRRVLVTLICFTCAILLIVALAFNLTMRTYIRSRVTAQLTTVSESATEERRDAAFDRVVLGVGFNCDVGHDENSFR